MNREKEFAKRRRAFVVVPTINRLAEAIRRYHPEAVAAADPAKLLAVALWLSRCGTATLGPGEVVISSDTHREAAREALGGLKDADLLGLLRRLERDQNAELYRELFK